MKRVKIEKLKIENFRGIKSLEFDFSTGKSQVRGKNGSGKSTLYNAYLWGLFGKDGDGKSIDVQPLTEQNEVVHKVVTSVEIALGVDGRKITIQRKQREEWSVPRGKTEEVLKGNVQERFFNEVPCSVSEFRDKLNDICNVDDWFMLSSISAFMGIEQKERRKKLTAIAGEISEAEITKPFPEIKAAIERGKTIEELARQTKNSRTKAKQDLDELPARIDQAKKMLEPDYNYTELEIENEEIERKIAEIDAEIAKQVTDDKINKIDELLQRKNTLGNELARIVDDVRKERFEMIEKSSRAIKKAQLDMVDNQRTLVSLNTGIDQAEKELQQLLEKGEQIKADWMAQNEVEFKDSTELVCPLCGSKLPDEKVDENRQSALKLFNKQKLERLADLEYSYKENKTRCDYCKSIIEDCTKSINIKNSENEELKRFIDSERERQGKFQTEEELLQANDHYKMITGEMDALNAEISALKNQSIKQTNDSELKAKKAELQAELKENLAQLQVRTTNDRIWKMIGELENQSKTTAQIIASLDKVEYEIQCFKKAKIECVENQVSGLFKIVRWKMYEPNLTNDGEKEICQAIIDGKPFEQQNTATKVNAGIDIINGISKAYEVRVPMFIDNKESVTNLIESDTQTITLEVAPSENLNLK